MKRTFSVLLLLSLVCGCGTFGTFTGIEKDKTSKTQIVGMMGNPVKSQYIDGGEIWKYQFVQQDGRYEVIMDLGITFKGDTVKDYQLNTSRVLKEKVVARQPGLVPAVSAGEVTGVGTVSKFISEFDRDKDGNVAAAEFPGPKHLFDKWDKNGDGYVDAQEAVDVPPPPSHGPRSR